MTRIVAGRTNDVSVCSITMCVQHLVVCHCGSAACLPTNNAAVVYQLAERAKERIPFDSLLYAPNPNVLLHWHAISKTPHWPWSKLPLCPLHLWQERPEQGEMWTCMNPAATEPVLIAIGLKKQKLPPRMLFAAATKRNISPHIWSSIWKTSLLL